MTGKADFTEEEWDLVQEGPAIAGIFAAMASSGGSFRESWGLAKSYAEGAKEQEVLGRLREAVALLGQKATPEEVEAYRGFVLEVAHKVALAHKEEGTA